MTPNDSYECELNETTSAPYARALAGIPNIEDYDECMKVVKDTFRDGGKVNGNGVREFSRC